MKYLLAIVILASLFIVGCSGDEDSTPISAPTITVEPTITGTPTIEPTPTEEPSPVIENPDSPDLSGTQWVLVSYPDPDDPMAFIDLDTDTSNRPTLEFTSDNAVSGDAGCNSYFGSYEIDSSGQLNIKDVASTMMACLDEGAMDLENLFLFAMGTEMVYDIVDGSLRVQREDTGVFSFRPKPEEIPVPKLKVHFIDVGQGDAILCDLGETEILIDGGDKSSGVVEYIQDIVDGPLEVMIATHPLADHIGGLIDVLETYEVENIWLTEEESDSKIYADFSNAIGAEQSKVYAARTYGVISAGELSFNILHPSTIGGSTNNNSIVLYMQYGEVDFLFTGDAEIEAETEMLESGIVPDIEVLKLGYHASRTASSQEFLDASSPLIAVYMCEEGNSDGQPHQETLDKLEAMGIKAYGTDTNGTTILTVDKTGFEVNSDNSQFATYYIVADDTPVFPPVQTIEPGSNIGVGDIDIAPVQTAECGCSGDWYDCSDFDTQGDAQDCYDYCITEGGGDVHHLDSDGNGVVCTSLPE